MNYANLKLDEILLQRIKNLVDKNEVEAKDVKQEASELLPFDTWLYVNWVFDAEHSNDKVAGGRGAQLHFGYDEDAFLSHSNKLYEAARTNTQLRTNFIESLRNNDIKALRLCEEVQTYHEFDRFSFCSRCNQCGGRGEVSCYRCSGGGHNHCYSCEGSGFVRCIEISPSNVSNIVNKSCGVCFGTGRSTCLTCSGRGKITCLSCGGNGFFTHYRKIYAQASPSYRFVTDSAKFNSELEAFLNANLPSFLAGKMPFEFVGQKTVAKNKEYFCYRAQSILTRLDFSILGKIGRAHV